MSKARERKSGAMNKALFQSQSVRVLPVRSLAYAFFVVAILFVGLAIVDRAIGYEKVLLNDVIAFWTIYERFSMTEYGRCQLMIVKGSELPAKEKPRILVVGDSFVWGEGLTNVNQIWWSLMSSELERRGYDCEVYAVAATGASTYDEFVWLRDSTLLQDIQPDLIVLGYYINDPDLDTLGMGLNGYYPASRINRSLYAIYPSLSYYADTKLVEKVSRAENNRKSGYTCLEENRKFAESPNLEHYNNLVVRPLGEFAAQLSIPMIAILTPESPDRWAYGPHLQNVIPLFGQAGIPFFSPFEQFVEYCASGSHVTKYMHASPLNPHPGPATSWFLGNYAADVVEQNYASILGEKRTDEKAYPIEINDWIPYMLEPRAVRESASVSQYVIAYPDQSSEPDFENRNHGNFLTLPLRQKYVKLNFKYPVNISCVKIEGEDLLSARVWTLGINQKLGFDDQKPVKWTGKGRRYVTSLLISAKTVDGRQAALTITIEGEVAG